MNERQSTAQEILQEIRTRPYVRIAAMGGDYVSLWKRVTLLYRLYMRSKEASLDTESTPVVRRREEARLEFWRTGGDLSI